MDSLIDYFSNMPSAHRTVLLVGGLAFFWLIESAAPLFNFKYNKWKHAGVNIFFTLTTVLINFSMAFILVKASDYVVATKFGILQWIDIPVWATVLLGLMLLDFIAAFLIHYTEHKIKWMWQLHLIHHTDKEIDTTSANRHHPGESVLRFIFTAAAVVITGAPMWLVFVYQTASLIMSQFIHANLILPRWLDRILVLILCTPNMHHVHHHHRMPYSDSNFGNIFSIWDRIFGTYSKVDNSKLIYGLDTYPEDKENMSIATLLKIPFSGYRKPINYSSEEKL